MTLEAFKAKGGEVRELPPSGWKSAPGPKYELLAPDGYRFEDDLHGLMAWTMKDVRDRLKESTLERCPADCGCGEGSDD